MLADEDHSIRSYQEVPITVEKNLDPHSFSSVIFTRYQVRQRSIPGISQLRWPNLLPQTNKSTSMTNNVQFFKKKNPSTKKHKNIVTFVKGVLNQQRPIESHTWKCYYTHIKSHTNQTKTSIFIFSMSRLQMDFLKTWTVLPHVFQREKSSKCTTKSTSQKTQVLCLNTKGWRGWQDTGEIHEGTH